MLAHLKCNGCVFVFLHSSQHHIIIITIVCTYILNAIYFRTVLKLFKTIVLWIIALNNKHLRNCCVNKLLSMNTTFRAKTVGREAERNNLLEKIRAAVQFTVVVARHNDGRGKWGEKCLFGRQISFSYFVNWLYTIVDSCINVFY